MSMASFIKLRSIGIKGTVMVVKYDWEEENIYIYILSRYNRNLGIWIASVDKSIGPYQINDTVYRNSHSNHAWILDTTDKNLKIPVYFTKKKKLALFLLWFFFFFDKLLASGRRLYRNLST